MAIIWIIAFAVFIADFLIKTYLRANFAFESIPVIKNIFHITVVFNSGAAFGFLQGKTNLLIYISLIFVLFFLIFIKKENKKNWSFYTACGLILGGALSNLYDRAVFGFVIDYIDIRVWPVFNISDSCITAGALLLFWESYKIPRKKYRHDKIKRSNAE